MAARDVFHHAVKEGLIKDGWTVTADPLVVPFGGVDLYIDLGAEKLIAAEKDNERIAVEVKSFLGPSLLSNFHTALGQFLNYRLALDGFDPRRTLYLAVPIDIHSTFFALPFTQAAMQRHEIHRIVYDSENEVLVQWIK
jgi:XisH protein